MMSVSPISSKSILKKDAAPANHSSNLFVRIVKSVLFNPDVKKPKKVSFNSNLNVVPISPRNFMPGIPRIESFDEILNKGECLYTNPEK